MTAGHSELNAAISKLRETAAPIAHFGTDWTVQPGPDGSWLVVYTTDHPDAGLIAQTPDYGRMDLADWIALMDPAVGERLITLLERINELAPYWAEPYAAAYVPILEAAVRLASTLTAESEAE